MEDFESVFPKQKMIDFFKSISFKTFNSKEINSCHIDNSTYNPFDKDFILKINMYPALIKIDRYKDKYEVRIGKNTGWIGGLGWAGAEFCFIINKLNFEDFKKGLEIASKNQKYSLVSKYGTGNMHHLIMTGSIDEIRSYGIKNGYKEQELKNSLLGFYLYNENLNTWDDKRLLYGVVLSNSFVVN